MEVILQEEKGKKEEEQKSLEQVGIIIESEKVERTEETEQVTVGETKKNKGSTSRKKKVTVLEKKTTWHVYKVAALTEGKLLKVLDDILKGKITLIK